MKKRIAKIFMGSVMGLALFACSAKGVYATETAREEAAVKQYAASQAEIEANGTVLTLNQAKNRGISTII